ncbi:MAG: GDP-L-fucose synthase [Terrimicrobium sp.]|jgi:GDP-L-fucose synthase|nr:GDP-L-fucose synthase [Terrimicrobiaceae bacterium]
MQLDDSIFVAGHRGMVGGAVVRRLSEAGFGKILTRSRAELDLLDRAAVRAFFDQERPSVVVDAAAKVGGIVANNEQPVEFLLQNVAIQNNLIEAAADFGTRKLLFLGSSCIYPKMASQPISESALLTGPLEVTNEAYAIAKIAGVKLCQAYAREYGKTFISAMPANLYGPNDNFDLHSSHVLPALIRKAHEAKERGEDQLAVWGTGMPRREFLHANDLADACLFLLERYDSPEIINVGCGEDVTIRELAEMVCDSVGFRGSLVFDATKPDGTPRKLLDVSLLFGMGWRPKIALHDGIRDAYRWFVNSETHQGGLGRLSQ